MPQITVDHIEEFGSLSPRFQAAIDRYLMGNQREEDEDTLLEIVEIAVPNDFILFPNEADITINAGVISATANILEILEVA